MDNSRIPSLLASCIFVWGVYHFSITELCNGGAMRNRNWELILAASCGRAGYAKALLAVGADVHVGNDTPVRLAAFKGHIEITRILVAAGANIHACGDEASRWAALFGKIEVLRALIGADNVFDAGKSPRGYRFLGLRLGDEIIVSAGRWWFNLREAREHWANNEDALTRVEHIAKWDDEKRRTSLPTDAKTMAPLPIGCHD